MQDEVYNFIESRKSVDGHVSNKCYEYCDVSICLIDIVGFSSWCNRNKPFMVTSAMIEYNQLITSILEKYENLTKIELVGDSCLIVGGMHKLKNSNEHSIVEMIDFCLELINNNIDKTIFNGYEVGGIRIGLHVGDVFGTFLNNPHRFQLFGNDINIASRLETTSFPNVIHVSLKASEQLQMLDFKFRKDIDHGIINKKIFKGLGQMFTKYLTPKCDKVMLIYDMKLHQSMITTILKSKWKYVVTNDVQKSFEKIKQKRYKLVIIYCKGVLEELQHFRLWETQNRKCHQKIIGVTDYKSKNTNLFDAILMNSDIQKKMISTCNRVIEQTSSDHECDVIDNHTLC